MSLAALAALVGAGQPFLSDIENWKKKPSLDLACKLFELTCIHPCEFNREPKP